MLRLAALSVATLLAAAPAVGQEAEAPAEPPIMERAVNSPRVDSWSFYGPGLTQSLIDAEVQGGKAIRVTVPSAGANPWDAAAQAYTTKPIRSGDVMLLGIWLRSDTPGATVNIRLQGSDAPYPEVAAATVQPTAEWKLWFARGTAGSDFAAARANATVQLAGMAQTVELGPVFIFDFGQGYDMDRLPGGDQ